MGYLKSGISRCVAVLSACGVVTVSAVTFAALDKNVIQPCAVMPPENAKVISAVSDAYECGRANYIKDHSLIYI